MCFGGGKQSQPTIAKKDPDSKQPDEGDTDATRQADLARRRRAGYAGVTHTSPAGVVVGANQVAKKQLFGA